MITVLKSFAYIVLKKGLATHLSYIYNLYDLLDLSLDSNIISSVKHPIVLVMRMIDMLVVKNLNVKILLGRQWYILLDQTEKNTKRIEKKPTRKEA